MGSSRRTSGGGSEEQLALHGMEFCRNMRGDVNISGDKKDQVCKGIQIQEAARPVFDHLQQSVEPSAVALVMPVSMKGMMCS